MGGFKRLEFRGDKRVSVEFLPSKLFEAYDCHLIFTGVTRESKTVLKDVAHHVDKSMPLLEIVDRAYDALLDEKFDLVLDYLNESWEEKKRTSHLIAANPTIQELDSKLACDGRVLAHKLCGAGNGGFFLCFTERDAMRDDSQLGTVKVRMSTQGVEGYVL